MPRGKNKVDICEINEIIDLYIKQKLNGLVSKLNNHGVWKFNEEIANNPRYIRSNGNSFKLYKYNVWGGSYNGEDGLGKAVIKERLANNEVKVIGDGFNPLTIDIVKLVNDLHSKPEKLVVHLCNIFKRERDKICFLEEQVSILKEQRINLQAKLELMDKAVVNLMYQSQSPGNSLNDMFNMNNSEDSICFDELSNMFNNDNERIASLLDRCKDKSAREIKDTIIPIDRKSRKEKYKNGL